ncbi:MAG: hypothetical protein JSW51_02060, partial [Gemmatimonadota bacterium]
MIALLLAVKAEIVLGVLLVLRHRTPRLAAVLVIVVVATSLLAGGDNDGPAQLQWVVFVIAGSLVAVSASRVLAPGAALSAAYRVGAAWWLVPSARLSGALCVPLLIVVGVTLVMDHSAGGVSSAGRMVCVIGLYATALAALVMALTAVLGASAGAAIGFMAAW